MGYSIRQFTKRFFLNMTTLFIVCLFVTMSIGCSSEGYDDLENEIYTNNYKSSSQSTESQEHSRSESNEQHNMLTNGGLEEWRSLWTPEMPVGWSLPNNEYVKQNKTVVYEGSSSAKMQSQEKGKTARLEQTIQVTPHEIIRIRFLYYVEQWKSKGARTYCYFRTREAEASNISVEELKEFYDNDTYYIIRGGGYGQTYLPHEQNVWLTFDEIIEVPPTATYFAFGINSYNGTTIYVDDCFITDASEDVSTGIKPVTM